MQKRERIWSNFKHNCREKKKFILRRKIMVIRDVSTANKPLVTAQMVKDFDEKGYFVLPNVIDLSLIQKLRESLDEEIELIHKEMDRLGVDQLGGITHRGKRYFINDKHVKHQAMYEHLFGPTMKEICRAILGINVWLFFEQFVVKAPKAKDGKPGLSFAWHQDSAYVEHSRPFYLSCWAALDDMTEANGTLRVLPYAKIGGKKPVTHFKKTGVNDLVGYDGPETGELVEVPVGSVVVFSSYNLHSSGENHTDKPRRSYLAQYSTEPIYDATGKGFHAIASPFLKNGDNVSLSWAEFNKK